MDAADRDGDGNGDNLVRLTSSSAEDGFPAWSPDGRRIAFVSNRDGDDEIYLMDAADFDRDGNGDNLVRLTSSSADDGFPAWSPDGKRIAFVSDRDGNQEIYIMDAADIDRDGNGDNLARLTDDAATDGSPAWSPDGTHIAFVSDRDGLDQIYVMNADGSNQNELTDDAAQYTAPDWSPDGRWIAFQTNRDGNYEIYVMDATGLDDDDNGYLVRLTNSSASAEGSPVWSRSGRQIAFQSNRDGNYEIYVMDAADIDGDGNGDNLLRLTHSQNDDFAVSWGPTP